MRTLRRFIDRSPGNRLEKLKGRRAGQHSIRINTDALRSWAPERSRFVFVFLGRYRWAYSICPPLSSGCRCGGYCTRVAACHRRNAAADERPP